MNLHLKPETELRLNELASNSGCTADDLVEDALAGYLSEVAALRQTLDDRYDELKSGRVEPVDGEAFFQAGAGVRMNSKIAPARNEREPGFLPSPCRDSRHPRNLGVHR
jgi:hypothetical protein